jgi:uncharacterized membrane protein
MNSRYFWIASTVAIFRITIAQLGVVFPVTMEPPAEATSLIVLLIVGIYALIGIIRIWQETPKLKAGDLSGIAGIAAAVIVLDIALRGLEIWLGA